MMCVVKCVGSRLVQSETTVVWTYGLVNVHVTQGQCCEGVVGQVPASSEHLDTAVERALSCNQKSPYTVRHASTYALPIHVGSPVRSEAGQVRSLSRHSTTLGVVHVLPVTRVHCSPNTSLISLLLTHTTKFNKCFAVKHQRTRIFQILRADLRIKTIENITTINYFINGKGLNFLKSYQ